MRGFFLFLVLAAMLAAGCGETEPPAVDITGIWTGAIEGQDGQNIDLIVEFEQSGGSLSGEISLWDPGVFGLVTGLHGGVRGYRVTFRLDYSEAPVRFEGTADSTVISGTAFLEGASDLWSVSFLGNDRVQEVSRVPVELEGIISFNYLLYDGDHYMVVDYHGQTCVAVSESGQNLGPCAWPAGECRFGVINTGTELLCSAGNTNTITRRDPTDGSILGSIDTGDVVTGWIAWDGQYVWSLGVGSNELSRISTDGQVNLLGHVPGQATGFAYDGTSLWVKDETTALLRLDAQGAVVGAAHNLPRADAQHYFSLLHVNGAFCSLSRQSTPESDSYTLLSFAPAPSSR